MSAYLSIHDLRKSYGEGEAHVEVLRGITTEVERGEICVLLGPSGSGKSTFLNLVGGLEPADSGSIRVGDTELTTLRDRDLVEYRRRELGFIFQFYNLVPNLTVRENIEVCRYLSPNPLDIDEMMESLGILAYKNKFPSQLSGGQQQRCAIARALVKNPKLLLCDEPTGALDSVTSRSILMLLEEVNRKYGTTMLIVTHNNAIRQMVHQVIEIRDGRITKNYENEVRKPASELEDI